MPNLVLADTVVVVDVALASIAESPEGADGPSVVVSQPGGVDRRRRTSWTDTACPVQPEESLIIPEAAERSPSPMDSWPVSTGASAPTFPGGQGIEGSGFPGFAPSVSTLLNHMDDLDAVAIHHQRMMDRASYDRWIMRRALRVLARIAGVDTGKPDLGCQCPGKH